MKIKPLDELELFQAESSCYTHKIVCSYRLDFVKNLTDISYVDCEIFTDAVAQPLQLNIVNFSA